MKHGTGGRAVSDVVRIATSILLGVFIRLWWDERRKNRGDR